jgi:hypothetical protein
MSKGGTRLIGWRHALGIVLAAAALGCSGDAAGPDGSANPASQYGPFGAWTSAVRMETLAPGAHASFNTTFADGCPSTTRDGKTFFIASNRPGSQGLDIWISRRASTDQPWGEPANAGEAINTAANEFCPMASRDGNEFYFVSNRAGGCGGDDIYVTRIRDDGSFEQPRNLGCTVNSAANEAGPVPVAEPGGRTLLYFSSTRPGGFAPDTAGAPSGDSDLYTSELRDGQWQAAVLVPGANSAQEDGQPYIQHDALELYFFSTRPGGLGAQDIWKAARAHVGDAWSAPVNLGDAINSPASETRPSLSWDGTALFYGSTRSTNESNIFVSVRPVVAGSR